MFCSCDWSVQLGISIQGLGVEDLFKSCYDQSRVSMKHDDKIEKCSKERVSQCLYGIGDLHGLDMFATLPL
jgi:hypothetical protein